MVRYLVKATGLSCQQVTRLIGQFPQDRAHPRPPRPFPRGYTRADVLALGEFDALHDNVRIQYCFEIAVMLRFFS